jgi:Uncharacterized protein conserved in bacteria (DUF2330)
MRRIVVVASLVTAIVLVAAPAALACGSLVAANGAVQLVRTSTLAAYQDGVEHYVTNFEFAGKPESFGSVVPLPAEPTKVQRAGRWTLQRLSQEVAPPVLEDRVSAAEDAAAPSGVEVIEEKQIASLDVAILKGGGEDVAAWAESNGFDLTPDTPEVLEFYSRRSPYFMAVRFDAKRAAEQDLAAGDGIPVHLTIPTDDPWVPLRILSTGKPDNEVVAADVFLLTEQEPALLTGDGVSVERSEPASDVLLDDLRDDRGMEWVGDDLWFTYLAVDAEAGDLDYDLAVDAYGGQPSRFDAGFELPPLSDDWSTGATVAVLALAGLALMTAVVIVRRPGRTRPTG